MKRLILNKTINISESDQIETYIQLNKNFTNNSGLNFGINLTTTGNIVSYKNKPPSIKRTFKSIIWGKCKLTKYKIKSNNIKLLEEIELDIDLNNLNSEKNLTFLFCQYINIRNNLKRTVNNFF